MFFGIKSNTLLAAILVFHLVACLIFSFFVYPILEKKFELDITQDEYDDLGWSLAQGNGFRSYHGEKSVIRGPGYPAFLAAIYVIAGHNFQAVQLVQCLLSTLIILLTWLIGRQFFSQRVTILATAVMALNPLLIWYVPRIMVEVPFTLVCLLVFYFSHKLLKEKVSWADYLFTSLSIAAAAYIKSIALIFPFIILVMLIVVKRQILKPLITAAIVGFLALLCVLPWSIRNYNISGEIVPVHTSLALPIVQGKLYVDNFAASPFSTKKAMLQTKETMEQFSLEGGGRAISYPLAGLKDEIEIDRSAKKYIISYYQENPLELVKGMAIRSLLFWYYSSNSLFSVFLLLLNAAILFIALLALIKFWKIKTFWIPVIWTLFFVGFHSLIIASARFSLQLHPYLLLLASAYLLSRFTKEEVIKID